MPSKPPWDDPAIDYTGMRFVAAVRASARKKRKRKRPGKEFGMAGSGERVITDKGVPDPDGPD